MNAQASGSRRRSILTRVCARGVTCGRDELLEFTAGAGRDDAEDVHLAYRAWSHNRCGLLQFTNTPCDLRRMMGAVPLGINIHPSQALGG